MDKGISVLAENPELGVSRDEVREGYRVLFINSHATYYTITASSIFIVRVLHEQMDPRRVERTINALTGSESISPNSNIAEIRMRNSSPEEQP